MILRTQLSAIAIFYLCTTAAFAVDPPKQRENIAALVDQLVSPNKAPKEDSPDFVFPREYDNAAQERVLHARTKLYELGLSAVPFLLARSQDRRYSFTQEGAESDENWSVGHTCVTLVRCQLEPYGVSLFGNRASGGGKKDPRSYSPRPNFFLQQSLSDPQSVAKWWEAHNNKSLRELQIEVLAWTISEEERHPDKYSDRDVKYLKDKLNKLTGANDPLPIAEWPMSK